MTLSKQEPMFNEAKSQASPFLKEKPEVILSLSNTCRIYVSEKGSLAEKIHSQIVVCNGRLKILPGVSVTQPHRAGCETDLAGKYPTGYRAISVKLKCLKQHHSTILVHSFC